jgi:hypothetical protein
MSLNIKSLGTSNAEVLEIVDLGDESDYVHCSLDHISDIPTDFISPVASLIIHEEELGDSIVLEHLYTDRVVDAYRPYTAAEFKLRSSLLEEEANKERSAMIEAEQTLATVLKF